MSNPENSKPSPSSKESRAALIVIDMQNDFVYGSLPVPEGAAVIGPINQLIQLPFPLKIATRDFHPDNHVSFAATHKQPPLSTKTIFHPEDQEEAMGAQQTLWPIHCVAYTGGADFVPGLITHEFDQVIHKGTHPSIESYSAFRDIWNRTETELPQLLAEHKITDLYFCGLAGDYCVKYTAIDSLDYGYPTYVVEDAVKSIASDNTAYEMLKEKGVKFTTVEELAKKMTPEPTKLV